MAGVALFEASITAKVLVKMLECVIRLLVSQMVVSCQSLGGGGIQAQTGVRNWCCGCRLLSESYGINYTAFL